MIYLTKADEKQTDSGKSTGKEALYMRNFEGKTVIIITHDNAIAESTKRIIRISDGKIAQ